MKTYRRIPLAILAVAALLASSCVSLREQQLREFDRAALAGMVYDWEQKPCAGAELIVDGREGPRTDLNGRFVIGDLARGGHAIRIVKDGYEPLETRVEFLDRTQVLYLRVPSHAQLVREAEEALARKEMRAADALLLRAESVDPDDPVGRYLRALYLMRVGDAEGAAQMLERLLASGFEEPAVYLSLADIYQYRIGDRGKAAGYLREYLSRVNRPDVRARLEGLEP